VAGAFRIDFRTKPVIIFTVIIPDPFQDVSRHVVQAVPIGFIVTYRGDKLVSVIGSTVPPFIIRAFVGIIGSLAVG
jgi:hypothetical protein